MILALLLTALFLGSGDPLAPDPVLTPGVINPAVRDPCATKWSLDRRHVTRSMRKEVFRRYKLDWERRFEFEVDHRVPRELGGADDILNLWPQSWSGPYNAHMKDRLENRVHVLVCEEALNLHEAQALFEGDWTEAYEVYCR